jgi:predicted site-specific integrase-resolvase
MGKRDSLITPAVAATIVGVSRRTISNWCREYRVGICIETGNGREFIALRPDDVRKLKTIKKEHENE